jgi:hypothetical protein
MTNVARNRLVFDMHVHPMTCTGCGPCGRNRLAREYEKS